MIRRSLLGLTTVAMLSTATPTALDGYWTGHAEIFKTIIENWILNHTRTTEPAPAAPCSTPAHPEAAPATPAGQPSR